MTYRLKLICDDNSTIAHWRSWSSRKLARDAGEVFVMDEYFSTKDIPENRYEIETRADLGERVVVDFKVVKLKY